MWSRSPKWAAILLKSGHLCLLLQLFSVCGQESKGPLFLREQMLCLSVENTLPGRNTLPHRSGANKRTHETQRHPAESSSSSPVAQRGRAGLSAVQRPRTHTRNSALSSERAAEQVAQPNAPFHHGALVSGAPPPCQPLWWWWWWVKLTSWLSIAYQHKGLRKLYEFQKLLVPNKWCTSGFIYSPTIVSMELLVFKNKYFLMLIIHQVLW